MRRDWHLLFGRSLPHSRVRRIDPRRNDGLFNQRIRADHVHRLAPFFDGQFFQSQPNQLQHRTGILATTVAYHPRHLIPLIQTANFLQFANENDCRFFQVSGRLRES